MIKPETFTFQPWGSIFAKSESETIIKNIMVILWRTGNEWRDLPWDEYKSERMKDGNFTEREKQYFDQVKPYTLSEELARMVSLDWKKA